jgi:hypothetical protein
VIDCVSPVGTVKGFRVEGFRLRLDGSGRRVYGSSRTSVLCKFFGLRISGSGLMVQGAGFMVYGSGCGAWVAGSRVEDAVPCRMAGVITSHEGAQKCAMVPRRART